MARQGVNKITDPLFASRLLTSFSGDDQTQFLPDLCHELLKQQKESWQELHDNYTSLDNVRVREFMFKGFSFKIQFNPVRITSTRVKLDEKTISKRKCFLCVENLPQDQTGILYKREYLILCNPAPILPGHYTILHIDHIPQSIERRFKVFLLLARDLGPHFTLLYNGPKCGASAPDHLHFQAIPAGEVPIEKDILSYGNRLKVKKVGDVSLFKAKSLKRCLVIAEGKNLEDIEAVFGKVIDAMKYILSTIDEPMMNMLCSYSGKQLRLLFFLRRKHRPDVYFRKGGKRVLISPGAIDMGGLIITPIEKDFMRVNADIMENIFGDVALEEELFERIVDRI